MFKPTSGRKTDDGVWKYFKYEPASDNSTCLVRLGDDPDGTAKTCSAMIKGKNATNLKNHIRFKHKHLVSELEQSNKHNKNANLDYVQSSKVRCFIFRLIFSI
jgi:hypothetical protein